MAKDDTARKRAAKVARDIYAYTNNLLRAFNDLLPRLKRAYGRPARDAAEMLSQHVVALRAIADFLKQMGPAHYANQLATLAQMLQDLNDGIHVPMLDPASVRGRRRDQTLIWLARAHVALAVEIMRRLLGNRKSAAKSAAERYPDLKQLITESGSGVVVSGPGADIERSRDLETAIISWCENFKSRKVKNDIAQRVYSKSLNDLKAWAPDRTRDELEAKADMLLQEALRLPQREAETIAEHRRSEF
jgi:hypothetical protein